MKQPQRNFILFSLFFLAICLEDILKNSLFNTWVQGTNDNGIHPFRKPLFTCTTPFLFTVLILFFFHKRDKRDKRKNEKNQKSLIDDEPDYLPLREQHSDHKTTKEVMCFYFQVSLIPLLSISSMIIIHYVSNSTDFSILQLVHAITLIFSSVFSHYFTRHKLNLRQQLSVAFFFISYLFFGFGVTLEQVRIWHHFSYMDIILYFFANCFIYISNVLEDRLIYDVIEYPENEMQLSASQEFSSSPQLIIHPSRSSGQFSQIRLKQKVEPSYLCFLESIFGIIYSFLFIFVGNFLFGKSILYEDLRDTLVMITDKKVSFQFITLCLLASLEKIISIIIVSQTSPLQTYLSISCGDIVSYTINSMIEDIYKRTIILSITCCIAMIIALNIYSFHCKH